MGPVEKYRLLVEQFLRREMPVSKFQETYLESFKNEATRFEDRIFEVLDRLFGDVDAYTDDGELLSMSPGQYIDEVELRLCAGNALRDLS